MKQNLFFDKNVSSLIVLQAFGVFFRGFLTNLIKEMIMPTINDVFGDPKFNFYGINYDISETTNYLILLIIGFYIIKLYNKPLEPSHFLIRNFTNINKKTSKELSKPEIVKIKLISSIYGLLSVFVYFIATVVILRLLFRK